MASNINPTKPESGSAKTADVRENFAAAKAEIEALQAGKQPLSARLTALVALGLVPDKLFYATGDASFASTDLTAFARSLLAAQDAGGGRTVLGAAPLSSPAFTGEPTAPTAPIGTSTTQIATTAFVLANAAASLAARAGIDPVLDFVFSSPLAVPAGVVQGSSAKYIIGRAGLLTSVATGVPPITFDPVTGATRGLLSEASAVALLQQSTDFSAGVWSGPAVVSSNTSIAPDGTMTADTLSCSGSGWRALTQVVAVANDTASRVLSLWFAKTEAATTFPGIQLLYAGGSVKVGSATLNTNTGVLTQRAGEIPDSSGVIDCGAYWRVWVTLANGGGNTSCSVSVYPAVSSDGATWAPALTGQVVAWDARLEAGTFPTSSTPTASSTVTRAADVNALALSSVPGWTPSEGTLYVEARTALGRGTQTYAQCDDGTNANRIATYRDSSGVLRCIVVVSGATVVNLSLGVVHNDTSFRVAFSWKANSFAASLNGAAAVTSSSGAIPSGLTTHRIGHDATGNHANAAIRRDVLFPRSLPSTVHLLTA